MTDKEKILAEIERLEKENCMNNGEHFCMRRALCLGRLRDIISPMMEEHVSEDLEEAIGEYCSNPDNFATWIGGKETDDIPLIIKAIKFGANWQKEQMMKKAVDGHATFEFYGIEGKAYGTIAHYPICLDDLGLKDTDKCKIIIIKEG